MRQLITFFIILFTFSAYSQYVRFDSTVIHQNRLIYNNAGYYIGKDSLHTKRVRLVFCSDTVPVDYDTLILRTPQRFITMDSVTGSSCPECGVPIGDLNDSLALYLKRSENDTIFGWLYLRDHLTTTPMIKLESGIDPYILDIGANNGILIGKSTGSATTAIFNDHISIERYAEYTPTFDSDVLVQSEIKDLISDSIATRPTLTTVRNEISDSLATFTGGGGNYIKKDANDTVTTYYTLWKDTGNEAKVTNNMVSVTDGTNTATTQPSQYYITDGADKGASMTPDGTTINDANTGASNTAYANHIEITRAGYAATAANEVPIVSEVKALINDSLDTRLASYSTTTQMRGEINDSLDTRLASYTPNGDLEEKIQDQIGTKLVQGTNITLSYNDATGETTVDAAGASGLNTEAVYDTIAYNLKVGTGLRKTKDDAGDSLLIELKLKDALERIVWSTGCHKMVFMPGNTTGATATWGVQVTVTGNVTAPGKSTSSKFMFSNRWETLVTAPATTAVAGFRCNTQNYGFGNSAGMGGYYFNGVAGPATGVSTSTHRFFWGMTQSIANPTDAQPSAQISCFGIGYDAADANLQFMHNDASGTCTKVDLGSNFPVPTSDRSSFWRLIMYSPSNTQEVYYKVIDMLDGDVYTGVATTDLPAKTDIFSPRGYASVGGTSSVIGFAIQQLEIFCDF